jgi:hypothetical protein
MLIGWIRNNVVRAAIALQKVGKAIKSGIAAIDYVGGARPMTSTPGSIWNSTEAAGTIFDDPVKRLYRKQPGIDPLRLDVESERILGPDMGGQRSAIWRRGTLQHGTSLSASPAPEAHNSHGGVAAWANSCGPVGELRQIAALQLMPAPAAGEGAGLEAPQHRRDIDSLTFVGVDELDPVRVFENLHFAVPGIWVGF